MKKINIFIHALLLPIILFANSRDLSRTGSGSFISGDSFRCICDHIYDEENQSVDPIHIQKRDIVFVKPDYLDSFFSNIHPYICNEYILITHNSDIAVPGKFATFLEDKKIIAWFAQNIDISHEKLHPIPIGIANKRWAHGDGNCVLSVQKALPLKEHLIYINFSIETYPQEREQAYNCLKKITSSYYATPKPFEKYLQDLASCKFIASPRGNGLDTHRLWESLYVGSYPIVLTSPLDPLYEDLPVIVIQKWEDVNEFFLEKKLKELENTTFNKEKLYIEYWVKKIFSYKKEIYY